VEAVFQREIVWALVAQAYEQQVSFERGSPCGKVGRK